MKLETLKQYFDKQIGIAKKKAIESSVRMAVAANEAEYFESRIDDQRLFFYERIKSGGIKVHGVWLSELPIVAEQVKSGDFPAENSVYPYLYMK